MDGVGSIPGINLAAAQQPDGATDANSQVPSDAELQEAFSGALTKALLPMGSIVLGQTLSIVNDSKDIVED